MTAYLVGYTIIGLIIAFVVFTELVSHHVILKNSVGIQKFFCHPLLKYSLRRIGSALISVALAIIVTFFLIRMQNFDNMCRAMFGSLKGLSEEVKNMRCVMWKDQMGLSGGPIEQLAKFLYAILPFPKTLCLTQEIPVDGILYVTNYDCRNFVIDLGRISGAVGSTAKPNTFVSDYIFSRMWVSFQVCIIASVLELALGYPLGILMAKHKDGVVDKIGKTYIITIDAIPGVAYYYIWMAILCGGLGLANAYDPNNFLTWLAPILTMAFTGMAGIALWVRRFMIDEMNSDYVKFARAKGLSENRIMTTHVLRNAIVPLVRSLPATVLGAFLGAFYIENIYGIKGIGEALITANNSKEYFLLEGIVIITALISVFAYLLGDIVTAMVDPRISLTSE